MIAAAAVADYKPKNSFEPSRKKKIVRWLLSRLRYFSFAQFKKRNQFWLDIKTENEVNENAKAKIQKKNLDLIV
jgi:phosphopantothenoylcysteine synthetase/decarboxylase